MSLSFKISEAFADPAQGMECAEGLPAVDFEKELAALPPARKRRSPETEELPPPAPELLAYLSELPRGAPEPPGSRAVRPWRGEGAEPLPAPKPDLPPERALPAPAKGLSPSGSHGAAKLLPLKGGASLRLIRLDEATIRVLLHPEHLGHLDLRIQLRNGHVVATVHASSEVALRLIEQHSAELRAALERQGLRLDRLELSQGSSSDSGGDSEESAPREPPPDPSRIRASPPSRAGPSGHRLDLIT